MTESWIDIPGTDGLYQVSSLGRVKATKRYLFRQNSWGQRAKILKPEKILKEHKPGYVHLTINGIRSSRSITSLLFSVGFGSS